MHRLFVHEFWSFLDPLPLRTSYIKARLVFLEDNPPRRYGTFEIVRAARASPGTSHWLCRSVGPWGWDGGRGRVLRSNARARAVLRGSALRDRIRGQFLHHLTCGEAARSAKDNFMIGIERAVVH